MNLYNMGVDVAGALAESLGFIVTIIVALWWIWLPVLIVWLVIRSMRRRA